MSNLLQISPSFFHETNQVLNSFPDNCDIDILLYGKVSLADTSDAEFGYSEKRDVFYLEFDDNQKEIAKNIMSGLIDGRHKLIRYGQ